MQKRIVAFLVAAVMMTGLCSCTADKSEKVKEIKIGISLYIKDDTFISSLYSALEEHAKQFETEKNCKISLFSANAAASQSTQNNQVDGFIRGKYDVVCVNLVDRTAAATIIDKAKSADIPLIFFNREPVNEDMQRWDKVYYVGADAAEAGELQAQLVQEAYTDNKAEIDKNGDGKIQYVILEGEQGHQDTLIRTEYCVKNIINSGISLEKLANDTANWQRSQASTKMTNWIEKFGDKLELVIANNDDMALGAIDALQQKYGGTNGVAIVGVDGITEALQAVRQEKMLGTVLNDAYNQSGEIMKIAYALSQNQDVYAASSVLKGKFARVQHKIITKDNVDKTDFE